MVSQLLFCPITLCCVPRAPMRGQRGQETVGWDLWLLAEACYGRTSGCKGFCYKVSAPGREGVTISLFSDDDIGLCLITRVYVWCGTR